MSQTISSKGLELIKSFETLELTAYPDPGSGGEPFTIGYGHTGGVNIGDTISAAEALELLRHDIASAESAVLSLVAAPVTQGVFDALVSFTFNAGYGNLEESTLRRRLNSGEPPLEVLDQELPRWNKGEDGPLAGLARRRAAEIALASGAEAPAAPAEPPKAAPVATATTDAPAAPEAAPQLISLKQAAKYSDGLAWQDLAWDRLQASITSSQLESFAKDFRSKPVAPKPAPSPPCSTIELDVPYLFQLDSRTPDGWRMCFSSTCAMLVEFLRPGALKGAGQADDHFLSIVERFGGSEDSAAQIKALGTFGIIAKFRQNGRIQDLDTQLAKGIPAPVGWLHRGGADNPSGGGHWSLVVGHDCPDKALILHDPNGEADLVGGGYVSNAPTAGRFVRYSERNWGPRWMVEGSGSGWWLEVVGISGR